MVKEDKVLLNTDDAKALIVGWLSVSTNKPDTYLTKEGMAYLNGYLQANNTLALVKYENYDKLVNDYAELLKKYQESVKLCEQLKQNEELKKRSWKSIIDEKLRKL